MATAPKVLKNFDVFKDGLSCAGLTATVTLPDLERKMEEINSGGFATPIDVDLGNEKMKATIKWNGLNVRSLRDYGITTVDGVMWRFAGAYQSDDTGAYDSLEVVMRGRPNKVSLGDQEVRKVNQTTDELTLVYLQISVNGEVVIEIDSMANKFVVDGVDLLAEQRQNMGHW
jgi:phage contractile tail tube protein, P2 family